MSEDWERQRAFLTVILRMATLAFCAVVISACSLSPDPRDLVPDAFGRLTEVSVTRGDACLVAVYASTRKLRGLDRNWQARAHKHDNGDPVTYGEWHRLPFDESVYSPLSLTFRTVTSGHTCQDWKGNPAPVDWKALDRSALYAFGDSEDFLLIYEPTIRQVVVIEGD